MAKQKKNNHSDIQPIPREAIAAVGCEKDFVELLRRELEWPIPMTVQRLADVAIPHDLQKDFGFKPEEERIAVSRLLSLTEDQPWGVFLFEFKTKRPYLSHLRRLLRVLGSQRTSTVEEHASLGKGTQVRLASRAVTGAGLVENERLVHLSAFRKKGKSGSVEGPRFGRFSERRNHVVY